MFVDRLIERVERVEARVLDWLIALALTGVGFLALATSPISVGGREPTLLTVALVLGMNMPLVLRRRHPDMVLSVVGISTIVYAVTGPVTTFGLGVLYALYSVGVYLPPRQSQRAVFWTMLGITASFVGVLFNEQQLRFWDWASQLITSWLAFGVAWLLGDLVRKRSEAVAELKVRAAELEAERGENERLAVEAERARIARELHDAVAHNVSVMVVQAGAARRTLEAGSADADAIASAREGLAAVETTGRDTMAEMRRMVGALRPADEAAYEPMPSLSALDGLLDRVRAAGLRVDLAVDGPRAPLPQGVDLSAYRVVQEALTNTLRHAHAASATVRLCYSPDALTVEVTDDGRGAAAALLEAPHHGYGLVGMRERVATLGGELVAGPRVGGGFEVRARLPLGLPA
ncbi:MAG: sensor histidine kinase [Chloroflexota bacterium]